MAQITERNNEDWTISISSLLTVLKREYKIISLITLAFSILGFFYIIITPKEYTSIGKIMPEVSFKAANGMGVLNDLLKKYNLNVDLYNTEITSPELYAEILNTDDFYNYILIKEVGTSMNKKMSFKVYYEINNENKKSFFHNERSDFKKSDKITNYKIIQDIQKRIIVTSIKKNNLIFVTVKMQDPVVAADVANFTIKYLIDYITKYRTEKARQELHFIENLQKSIMQDSSKNEALKNEIQNSLSASIIQMKIKIQEDTPTIQVLQKAQIPVFSNEPSLAKVLTGFTFLGFLIGVVVAFLKKQNYKTVLTTF